MRSTSSARLGFVPAPLANLPWGVLSVVLMIGSFGLLVMYSAAGGSVRPWALPQGIRFYVFAGAAVLLSRVPVATWRAATFPVYALLTLALVATELLGKISGGSQRWLDLGLIRLQPSELMKLAIVLTCARFYELLPPSQTRTLNAIWPAGVLIGLPAALVILQPDLGTAIMIALGGVTIMFLAGVPLRLFIGGALALAVAMPVAVRFLLHGYQKHRVEIFLNPESDPLGTGYHITQSKIAIGSGGILGKGFLHGTQSHLDYLPEGQTDFALATMMEEWGLVGGVLLIIAFGLVIRWAMGVALRAQTRFARLTAAGLAAMIFYYVAINMAMVMGMAPVVGVPLPLISFGGSAQMTFMLMMSILMAIDRESRRGGVWA